LAAKAHRITALFLTSIFLLTSVPLSTAVAASAAPIILVGHSPTSSYNWSGYAITGAVGSITTAQGSWVVPTVTCGAKEKSYSADWVGIDGFSSSTVEQTGTDSDCKAGVPNYYAWYEFYPAASKNIGAIAVHPGDVIAARVTYSSGSTFKVAIKDMTTGKSYSTSGSVSGAQRTSAEFIVEAPETCLLRCKLTSLSDFGTVSFSNCAVTVGGVLANIGTYGSAIQEITMVGQSNPSVVKAQPSAIGADGASFTVQWLNAGP
jgi:hypothetical protein